MHFYFSLKYISFCVDIYSTFDSLLRDKNIMYNQVNGT